MDLREQIANMLYEQMNEETWNLEPVADAVLAHPSGLIAVKECDYLKDMSIVRTHGHTDLCPRCHGTGRIVRPLSIKEALEWAFRIACEKNNLSPVWSNDWCFFLPSGERVMVEGGKDDKSLY